MLCERCQTFIANEAYIEKSSNCWGFSSFCAACVHSTDKKKKIERTKSITSTPSSTPSTPKKKKKNNSV